MRWQARAIGPAARSPQSHTSGHFLLSRILEGLLFGGHLSNLVPGFPFYSFAEVRERGRREEVDPENKVDISPERTLRVSFHGGGGPKGLR